MITLSILCFTAGMPARQVFVQRKVAKQAMKMKKKEKRYLIIGKGAY